MNIKKGLLILVLGLGLVSSSIQAKDYLTEEGCHKVAQAAGAIQHYVSEGKGLEDLIPDMSKIPVSLQEHLQVLEMVARANPKFDPQDHFEEYLEFCLATQGDLEFMNNYIRKMLNAVSI